MKISVLTAIQVCGLFMCHVSATGPRPKRTLKFFENLMDTMRETFGPEPPDLPPADVLAKVASLPYTNPYTYFPTVRMHIRPIKPVEKHVVYVKTLPPPAPAPLVLQPHLNDVEIIRLIQPLIRRPKSKTTTIHYEIIPISIPTHEIHAPIKESPFFSDSDSENEADFSSVPWSMDALPPPVPTSKPADASDEHLVPWQLKALPPPVATKRPYWQPIMNPLSQNGEDVFFSTKKKFLIPATNQQQTKNNFFDDKFMPSPLHSEISIEPSMEITAFSQTDSITVPPISNFRARRVFDKKDASSKLRPKRDTWSSFPIYAELHSSKAKTHNSTHQPAVEIVLHDHRNVSFISSVPPVPPLTFNARKFSNMLPLLEEPIIVNDDSLKGTKQNSKSNRSDPPSPMTGRAALRVPMIFDFGEYSDNEDADREDNHSANSEKYEKRVNSTDDAISIVKSHDILSDQSPPHEYISITPRPNAPKFLDTNKSKFVSRSSTSSFFMPRDESTKFSFQGSSALFGKRPQHRSPSYFDPSKFTFYKDALKIPETGSFLRSSNSKESSYDDLFGERRPQEDSNEGYFDKSSKFDFDKSSKFDFDKSLKRNNVEKSSKSDFEKEAKGTAKQSPSPSSQFDYDNIEYFEPIIIDIDDGRDQLFGSIFPKFKLKYKNNNNGRPASNKGSNEPLKLPQSLHETVDFIKTKSMHPPTFDLVSEADEHKGIAMIGQNAIR